MFLVDFYQHVININFYIMANLVAKNFVDEVLVSGFRVLQTKRHDLITVQPLVCNELYLLLVLKHHPDLVIP